MISFGYRSRMLCILRALVGIALGLVLIFCNDTAEKMARIVAIVAAIVGVAGVVWALVQKNDPASKIVLWASGVLAALGLLIYLFPSGIAQSIVVILSVALLAAALLQLAVFVSAMSQSGLGWNPLILSIIIAAGAAFLIFNPFSFRVMSIVTGCLFLAYGVADLIIQGKITALVSSLEKAAGEAQRAVEESLRESTIDDQGVSE